MNSLMHPPVSAIIPCFNHGKFIKQALNSILNQTYTVSEILIVDDGSTELETINILKSINNPIIKVYFNVNKGVSAARNFGFANAKNELLVTIDSDDYFSIDFIEKAVLQLINNEYIGAVSCWAQCFGESNEQYKFRDSNLLDFLIKNSAINAALIRKSVWELIGRYDENMLEGLEDWDFWIRLNKFGYSVKIIQESLFYYRIKEISRNQTAMQKHEELYIALLRKHKDVFDNNYPEALLYFIEHKEKIIQGLYQSYNYKFGSTLLKPFKFVKNTFKLKF